MAKRALITGITGQDGSYLAEFLLEKGYDVFGITRRSSTNSFDRIAHIIDKITLLSGDLLDEHSLVSALRESEPDEIYNLGAQSFVPTSWSQPVLTAEFTAVGVTRLLEAMRIAKPDARFYQASSSEMFGKVQETPQRESTPFYPRSPYGVAKVYAHWITINYRESYGSVYFIRNLVSITSPSVEVWSSSRVRCRTAWRASNSGWRTSCRLGNLDARRDWGHARDFVRAMWLMLQQPKPDDYVIATGKTRTVQDLVATAFGHAGLDWKKHVVVDPKFIRPAEVDVLVGDASKARRVLGWEPQITFEQMIAEMVDADLARLKKQQG